MIFFGLACLLIFIWAVLTVLFLAWWHHMMTARDRAARMPRHRVLSDD